MYEDGVGAWQFEYDFHPTGRAFHPDFGPAGPWECIGKSGRGWGPYSDRAIFPLRSLIPRRVDRLLGAQKNLGYSSLVSSAVRLHDQSMMVGQAAGAAAAVSLHHGIQPREIVFNRALLTEVRRSLCSKANNSVLVALWPFRDLAPSNPAFEAANLLATSGYLPLRRDEVDFQPNAAATQDWRKAIADRTAVALRAPDSFEKPSFFHDAPLTRGEFAERWWTTIRDWPSQPLSRVSLDDADGDGLKDVDDPLPLNPRNLSFAPSP